MVGYAELHCHSNFSFLDGASYPEELVAEAARLGLGALALTDHDGLYGVVRFAEAAKEAGVPTVFGAELTLAGHSAGFGGCPGRPGRPAYRDPRPARLPPGRPRPRSGGLRAASPAPSARAISPVARRGARATTSTGWPSSRRATSSSSRAAARGRCPPRSSKPVRSRRRGSSTGSSSGSAARTSSSSCSTTTTLSTRRATTPLPPLPCEGPRHRRHERRPPRRARGPPPRHGARRRSGRDCPLDELDGWLPAAGAAYLRSGAEQARRFARYPGAVELAGELGRACAFDLHLVAPKLPDFPVPAGHSEMTFLRRLVEEGATRRYGPAGAERVPGAWRQLEHELAMIEELGFAGYFLVVWDIVEFCRRSGIYCQGRGSAASSAVCYVLGITNADAVALGLLFERFLSPERDGPPDIDVDIESGRREEVIQYVYGRYGRERAALVAVVVSYRARSAVRDAAKALGHSPGQIDAWAKRIEQLGLARRRPPPDSAAPQGPLDAGGAPRPRTRRHGAAAPGGHDSRAIGGDGRPGRDDVAVEPGPEEAASELGIPARVLAVATELEGFPRHLGIHPGGMVICDRPVSEVCPVEWARMENRTVLQWDKDDCAAVGLVKFDLLGLGMLEAIHRAVDTVARLPPRRDRPRPDPPGGGRLRHVVRAATRWGSSRSRAGRRWPRCPGCGRVASTTSSSRSPSSARARSREGRFTPTCAGATGPRP